MPYKKGSPVAPEVYRIPFLLFRARRGSACRRVGVSVMEISRAEQIFATTVDPIQWPPSSWN